MIGKLEKKLSVLSVASGSIPAKRANGVTCIWLTVSLCAGGATTAVAQNLDVMGDVTLGYSALDTNPNSLIAALAPDAVRQGGLALQVGADLGAVRFSSEIAYYFEDLGSDGTKDTSDVNLNEGYLTWNSGDFSVIAGRKRTRWGTGLVASPTEIISTANSPLTPNDDFYRIQGRDLLQLSYAAPSSSVDLLLIDAEPDARHLEGRAAALRYYVNANGVDLSAVGGVEQGGAYVVGGNLAFTVGQSLELHADVLYDSDAASRQPIIDTLGQVSFGRASQVSALIGGNWTAPNDVNVILEYLYFQDGLSNGQFADLVNAGFVPTTSGATDLSLQQTHYMFGRVARDNVLGAVDVEYNFLKSLENDGYYQALRVTRDLDLNSSLFVELSDAGGARTTEFGQYPVNTSVQVGLTASF